MKLEIVKEEKLAEATWYCLKVDDVAVQFSRKLEEIEELFEQIKANPEIVKDRKTVLKCEEI